MNGIIPPIIDYRYDRDRHYCDNEIHNNNHKKSKIACCDDNNNNDINNINYDDKLKNCDNNDSIDDLSLTVTTSSESMNNSIRSTRSAVISNDTPIPCNRHNAEILLGLLHGSKCAQEFCTILLSRCHSFRHAFFHSKKCHDNDCLLENCFLHRSILNHFRNCHDICCPFCLPTRISLNSRNICSKPKQRGVCKIPLMTETIYT